MKIGVISLGCAKNLVDTENLLGLLKESNQEVVTSWKEADAIIINTCGFIESAKKEAIDTILEAADYKEKNVKKLVVMGCLAKRYKPQLEKELPEVDRFISIDEYRDLGKILTETLGVKVANNYGKAPRVLSGKPWMAYLRIADGCNNQCSYCAIPSIRGKFVSRNMEDIVGEAHQLALRGVKELNLIAQDSSMYGVDIDGKLHLSELLKKLDEIDGIEWIRVLYLYPDEIPDDLIDTMNTCQHVLPYFDIPIQHGSDHMLKVMHRRGSRELIIDRVRKIRQSVPKAVLRTTLICGHPGETLEDHEKNLSLVKQLEWDHLGAFTYSREENTPSYYMPDDVSEAEKNRRLQEIMECAQAISQRKLKAKIGMQDTVLVEARNPVTGLYQGRSAFYAPDGVDGAVYLHSNHELSIGNMCQVVYTKNYGINMIAQALD